MLNIFSRRGAGNCGGVTRRDFLQIGTLGLGGLTLAEVMAGNARAGPSSVSDTGKSVVWLFLAGGPTHVETFDPKLEAPAEYRSVTGAVNTKLPGVQLGGTFPEMAGLADKFAFVRSFAHTNSGHGGGTHFVMTGKDNRQVDNGGAPHWPGFGAMSSKYLGPNHPRTGMPTYVSLGGILGDGPAFLGHAYGPFNTTGPGRQNLTLQVEAERVGNRRRLLESVDRLKSTADRTGQMEGMTSFEQQAFSLLFGAAPKAFNLDHEDPRTRERYGKGLGEQMLLARRLCEAGTRFVTVSFGGWDMHGNIEAGMKDRGPQVDRAVAAFVEDCVLRGLHDDVLLVITGEFGRTPKINNSAGRDHWAPLSTLALSGGGLRMGQVIGESSAKLEVPKTTPITPGDLAATVFHVLGISPKVQANDSAGRPQYLVEGEQIAELV